MILNIASFIKSMLPSIGKSDIEEDLEISLEHLGVNIESWRAYAKVAEANKLLSKEAKNFVDTFYKELNSAGVKVRLKKSGRVGDDMVTLLSNVEENGKWLLKEISDSLNDVIMSQALTAYKANLLRAVAHLYFITRYSTDALSYLFLKESEQTGLEVDRDFGLNKKQIQFIEKNLKTFARIMAVYGEKHEEFRAIADGVSEVTLPQDQVEEAVHQYQGDKIDLCSNLPAGFIGSPIYSVRLVFAEWSADRYRRMKDEKRLLELRLLHYKLLKEQGTSDVTVEKEITYLQSRLTTLDKKLHDMEASL